MPVGQASLGGDRLIDACRRKNVSHEGRGRAHRRAVRPQLLGRGDQRDPRHARRRPGPARRPAARRGLPLSDRGRACSLSSAGLRPDPRGRVRKAGVLRSQAALLAIAIGWDGWRRILAAELANRESRSSRRDFLLQLRQRAIRHRARRVGSSCRAPAGDQRGRPGDASAARSTRALCSTVVAGVARATAWRTAGRRLQAPPDRSPRRAPPRDHDPEQPPGARAPHLRPGHLIGAIFKESGEARRAGRSR
jgi:Transposase, Mutator family